MSDAPQRFLVAADSRLRFAPHVKFRHDETRGRWVVLAPERLLLPDDLAVEILKLVDGALSVGGIVDDLARRFDAPREVIATDVTAMLQDLVDKGVLAA
ncbi:MAG TPA: pyrroloquinoline quinone biosynthesis peptide chaperone PqqD [Stellaceae bacterium]|nr:pyrroloquinoline quinone biosynthesis peptide chaperone PqqD [Stellaceae bacterium]